MLRRLEGIVLTSLLVAVTAGAVQAASVGWVKRYNGSGTGVDVASAVATDSAGNVYVTGWSQGAASNYDFVTMKYNSAGIRQWTRRYDGPGNGSDRAYAMAVDRAGNVYVTGQSWGGEETRDDWSTIKYNTKGKRLWVARHCSDYGDGMTAYTDYPEAIAVAGDGSVYVTGYSENPDWGHMVTIKYDKNGVKSWEMQAGYGHWGFGKAVVLDSFGDLYAAGWGGAHNEWPGIIVKYNPNGTLIWRDWYDKPYSQQYVYDYENEFHSIAVDVYGNVYVTGFHIVYDSISESYHANYLTIKYSTHGEIVWERQYNGPGSGDDYGKKIAVDQGGNVYVTGKSHGGDARGFDYVTLKYDSAGRRQWVRRFCGPGSGEDEPTGLALDVDGHVYVTGILSKGSNADEDWGTIKYDPDGNRVWVRKYNGPAGLNDRAKAMALDARGNVYVTGHSYRPSTGYDYCTIKYVQ